MIKKILITGGAGLCGSVVNDGLKKLGYKTNFELGISGPMEFHLTSPFSYTDASGNVTKDIDDYIQYETGMITGLSNFNTIPAKLSKTVRVPVQRKNDKYNLKIKVTDPFPIALISASWDGIYNQKRHVRR